MWLVILTVLFLLYFLTRKRDPDNLPPGPRPLPILGNILDVMTAKPFLVYENWRREFGDIVSARYFRKRFIFLNSYDVTREALVQHGDNFARRPDLPAFFSFTDGKPQGYVNLSGPVWKEQRRHALHVLRDFGLGRKYQEEKIETEIEDLMQEFDRRLECEGSTIDPVLPIKYAVVNIINSMLFGFRFKYDDERFAKLQAMIQENIFLLFKVVRFDILPGAAYFGRFIPYFFPRIRENVKYFEEFFYGQMEAHRKTLQTDFEENNGKNSDFTYAYISEMKRQENDSTTTFTERQLFWALLDLFAAGLETTATTLSWFLAYMAHHPDVQQKMFDELRSMSPGIPTYADRAKYPYTTAVIAEVERRATVAAAGVGHACHSEDTISGFHIPRDSVVMVNLWSIMRDPKLFPDPETFNPDRFLDEKLNGRHNHIDKVIPFSIGKRSCLGEGLARMELFMFTTAMIWNYQIDLPEKGNAPQLDDAIIGLTRSPLPFCIKMTKRHD